MRAFTLPSVEFTFGNQKSGPDKLRGLVANGPFRRLALAEPRFGFVFPHEHRDSANKLFLVLKNGIGLFRGVENTFRFRLGREQVFPIPVSGVDLSATANHARNAKAYTDAVLAWSAGEAKEIPDVFFVLHPKTPGSQALTPYYACKAVLLREAILSQNVTLDLINNPSQFEWSAANIALGAFVKLGGIPWVVKGEDLEQDLVIGIGRAYLYDPISRQTTGFMAFTACFSARGPLKFVSLGEVTRSRRSYIEALHNIVESSLSRADALQMEITSLTVHAPKEMQKEEMQAIRSAANTHKVKTPLQPLVVKVTDEPNFFAVDDQYRDGVPRRGTVVQVSDSAYMLYTEGREEKEAWTARLPVALRITPQGESMGPPRTLATLRQVNDLSQVNWRGLNARSRPISVYYGRLIAEILSHLSADQVEALRQGEPHRMLQERMWFL